MQFNCNQLSDDVLKSIFDAAFIDTEVDEDGDLIVKDDMSVWVQGMPEKDCFSFTAFFKADAGHGREKLLEACNAFNEGFLGLKASVMDDHESLCFNYALLMKGGGVIEGKEIVRLFKYFQDVIQHALDEEMFAFLMEE